MIATDTNILVYAHRTDSEWHERAKSCIESLAEGRVAWGIPWPCVHEFMTIATHPRIYDPPSSITEAVEQVDVWLESPVAVFLHEGAEHWDLLKRQVLAGQVKGPMVHDARIATICVSHGVTELWTADRDFSRFPSVPTRNPLLG